MGHSYHHALSSVRRFGGQVEDYLELHSWFDRSKATSVSPLHRMVLHHTEGVRLAVRHFGVAPPRASDGVIMPIEALGNQHVEEDLGWVPSLADWRYGGSALARLAWDADFVRRRVGGTITDYDRIIRWLDDGEGLGDPETIGPMLHHTFGIFLGERALGVTFLRPSDQRRVPTRVVLEHLLARAYRGIPTVEMWIRTLPSVGRPSWITRGVQVLPDT
jgi:hypothetical protein